MAWRNVDTAGPLLERHKVTEQNRRQAGGQRTLRLQPFEPLPALLHPQHTIVFELASLGHALDQLLGHN